MCMQDHSFPHQNTNNLQKETASVQDKQATMLTANQNEQEFHHLQAELTQNARVTNQNDQSKKRSYRAPENQTIILERQQSQIFPGGYTDMMTLEQYVQDQQARQQFQRVQENVKNSSRRKTRVKEKAVQEDIKQENKSASKSKERALPRSERQKKVKFIGQAAQQEQPLEKQVKEKTKKAQKTTQKRKKKEDDASPSKQASYRRQFERNNEGSPDYSSSGARQTEAQKERKSETFSKTQTRVLQKWFLDNIEHPYLSKSDKVKLEKESGLSQRQIQGWFTNNRKRKYQKIVAIAKKKNKDYSYVRDVMKSKFESILEPSSSGSQQSTRQAQESPKQQSRKTIREENEGFQYSISQQRPKEISLPRPIGQSQSGFKRLYTQRGESQAEEMEQTKRQKNDKESAYRHIDCLSFNAPSRGVSSDGNREKAPEEESQHQSITQDHPQPDWFENLEQKMASQSHMPVMLVLCPNILMQKPCNCGFSELVQIPSNKQQMSQFVTQLKEMQAQHSKQYQTQNSILKCGQGTQTGQRENQHSKISLNMTELSHVKRHEQIVSDVKKLINQQAQGRLNNVQLEEAFLSTSDELLNIQHVADRLHLGSSKNKQYVQDSETLMKTKLLNSDSIQTLIKQVNNGSTDQEQGHDINAQLRDKITQLQHFIRHQHESQKKPQQQQQLLLQQHQAQIQQKQHHQHQQQLLQQQQIQQQLHKPQHQFPHQQQQLFHQQMVQQQDHQFVAQQPQQQSLQSLHQQLPYLVEQIIGGNSQQDQSSSAMKQKSQNGGGSYRQLLVMLNLLLIISKIILNDNSNDSELMRKLQDQQGGIGDLIKNLVQELVCKANVNNLVEEMILRKDVNLPFSIDQISALAFEGKQFISGINRGISGQKSGNSGGSGNGGSGSGVAAGSGGSANNGSGKTMQTGGTMNHGSFNTNIFQNSLKSKSTAKDNQTNNPTVSFLTNAASYPPISTNQNTYLKQISSETRGIKPNPYFSQLQKVTNLNDPTLFGKNQTIDSVINQQLNINNSGQAVFRANQVDQINPLIKFQASLFGSGQSPQGGISSFPKQRNDLDTFQVQDPNLEEQNRNGLAYPNSQHYGEANMGHQEKLSVSDNQILNAHNLNPENQIQQQLPTESFGFIDPYQVQSELQFFFQNQYKALEQTSAMNPDQQRVRQHAAMFQDHQRNQPGISDYIMGAEKNINNNNQSVTFIQRQEQEAQTILNSGGKVDANNGQQEANMGSAGLNNRDANSGSRGLNEQINIQNMGNNNGLINPSNNPMSRSATGNCGNNSRAFTASYMGSGGSGSGGSGSGAYNNSDNLINKSYEQTGLQAQRPPPQGRTPQATELVPLINRNTVKNWNKTAGPQIGNNQNIFQLDQQQAQDYQSPLQKPQSGEQNSLGKFNINIESLIQQLLSLQQQDQHIMYKDIQNSIINNLFQQHMQQVQHVQKEAGANQTISKEAPLKQLKTKVFMQKTFIEKPQDSNEITPAQSTPITASQQLLAPLKQIEKRQMSVPQTVPPPAGTYVQMRSVDGTKSPAPLVQLPSLTQAVMTAAAPTPAHTPKSKTTGECMRTFNINHVKNPQGQAATDSFGCPAPRSVILSSNNMSRAGSKTPSHKREKGTLHQTSPSNQHNNTSPMQFDAATKNGPAEAKKQENKK